jgi:NAD(P)-dependent dehydrogenase (short-subunit alcohol dehydrogenase family)
MARRASVGAGRKPLAGQVALVAGATRGAGRGIACMLGEAGATVYCTGRSVRGRPPTEGPYAGRPETIEETAEMVSRHGGVGIAVRVDHLVETEVEALVQRIRKDQHRLDVLVNDISEGEWHDWKPFWQVSIEKGLRALQRGIHSHLITSRHAAGLMVEGKRGLIVEIGDGDTLTYRGTLFYDLVKVTVMRLAFAMAEELRKHGVAAVAVTPGYLRSEAMLDHFGVTEATWRDGGKKDPHFLASETPFFVGRAVAALAADSRVLEKSGGAYGSWTLAREYGFTDVDGSRPDLGAHIAKHREAFLLGPTRTGFRWEIRREVARRPDEPVPPRPKRPLPKGKRAGRRARA